ncbi:hypothetical protein [Planotetraspora sp. GP83]|uniref:hypothetical protein n=1 Tax=Planotetraspora sp. GP83 TaxID=3156264 RepID=UPI003513CAA6
MIPLLPMPYRSVASGVDILIDMSLTTVATAVPPVTDITPLVVEAVPPSFSVVEAKLNRFA